MLNISGSISRLGQFRPQSLLATTLTSTIITTGRRGTATTTTAVAIARRYTTITSSFPAQKTGYCLRFEQPQGSVIGSNSGSIGNRYRPLSTIAMASTENQKKFALFICDIQEGFRNAIYEFPTVISTAQKLLQAAQPLKIPIIATTQNASRLGKTVPEVSDYFPPPPAPSPTLLLIPELDKSLFSMVTPPVLDSLRSNNITSIAIVGIESHVCVLQTALDLLKNGFEVYAIADGISSCNKEEVPIAMARMRQEGVRVSTSESWLYEVMRDAARPEFREVLKVVKATKESTKDGLGKLCKSLL